MPGSKWVFNTWQPFSSYYSLNKNAPNILSGRRFCVSVGCPLVWGVTSFGTGKRIRSRHQCWALTMRASVTPVFGAVTHWTQAPVTLGPPPFLPASTQAQQERRTVGRRGLWEAEECECPASAWLRLPLTSWWKALREVSLLATTDHVVLIKWPRHPFAGAWHRLESTG